jgi:DNA gyrase subunit A
MGKKDKKKKIRESMNYTAAMFDTTNRHVEDVSIGDFSVESRAIYGSNVNLKRHILDISDSLKPIHRRLLMTLYDLKALPNKEMDKMSKCAAINGKLLEMYHPHGDDAAHEALVNMGQRFRNNVVYVSYDGNFGSAKDPKGYASKRYPDACMSPFAYDCFFSDWNPKNVFDDMTVDYVSTFTGKYLEPVSLPSKYPVFLINWHSSMGFGRSTCSVGFTPNHAFDAVIKLVDDPSAKFEMYPDDPQGCTLVNKAEAKGFLDRENVKFKFRAPYEVVMKKNKPYIEITATPFQVSPTTINSAIAKLHKDGHLPEIAAVSLSSEELGESFVLELELKKGYDPQAIMTKLYRKTQLAQTFSTRYAFVWDGENVDYTPRIAILEWIKIRRNQLRRMHKIQLINMSKRKHVLTAIIDMIKKNQVDEVVAIIRKSKAVDAPAKLKKRFGWTDFQSAKIAAMRLTALSEDNYQSCKDEFAELEEESMRISKIVKSNKALDDLIKDQQREGILKYGYARKSELTNLIDGIDVADTDHLLVFTNKYVKKLPLNLGGYKIGRLDDGDKVKKIMIVNNRDRLAVTDNGGKILLVDVNDIGNSTPQSVGISLHNLGLDGIFSDSFIMSDTFVGTVSSISKDGMITNTMYDDILQLKNKKGSYSLMKLNKDDETVKTVLSSADTDEVLVYSKNGKGLLFNITDIGNTSRNTKGVIAMKIDDGDNLTGAAVITKTDKKMVIATDRGYMKQINIKKMPVMARNSAGIELNSGNGTITSIVPFASAEVLYGYTNNGVFEFDPEDIKAVDRVGRNERILELDSMTYLIDVQK